METVCLANAPVFALAVYLMCFTAVKTEADVRVSLARESSCGLPAVNPDVECALERRPWVTTFNKLYGAGQVKVHEHPFTQFLNII